MATDPLDCALDLVRRLPPSNISDNLAGLLDLCPDLIEELLSAVDQPLLLAHDANAKRDYLLCDYNRDSDSYRSPWSNTYDPPLPDGSVPSASLREIEVQANNVFDIYRDLYYEGGVSSVYCWDLDSGFAAVVLIKKTQDSSRQGRPMKGVWDSIHVVEVNEGRGGTASYKLTSTVMLALETSSKDIGNVSLSGSITRQAEQEAKHDDQNPHVTNIGKMVESMENKLRSSINLIYFGKTKDVINTLRQQTSVSIIRERQQLSRDIHGAVGQ